ncbi:MAG: TatD family hydrolase [Candidatus Omnitrophica bacterium]|nr:TatD family hydrolase [Candidatus Omnitrophota bacterium]
MLVDTHCHLDFSDFDHDRDAVIARAQAQEVGVFINIGSSIKGSEQSVALSGHYEFVYASVGIHPHEADSFTEGNLRAIEALLASPKVVAVGEIGLDYFKNYSHADNQRRLFTALVALAKVHDRALVIHTRDAADDTLQILKDAMPIKAVVHCFSGSAHFLKECLDLGFFLSFTCNITYKKANALRNLVQETPLQRLFLETDAPFLSPEGLRGRRNEPASVRRLAEEIARIKKVSFEEVAQVTTANAKAFFHIA